MTRNESALRPKTPHSQPRIEYDWRRAVGRFSLACIIVVGIGVVEYGLIPPYYTIGPYPPCGGGLGVAAEFTGALLACVGFIESVLWSVWGGLHQEVLEAQEKERSRYTDQSGNMPSATTPPQLPQHEILSGGRLPLAPRGAVLGFLYVAMIVIVALVVGLPDPCVGPEWSAVSWIRYFISAFALLALCGFCVDRTIEKQS